MISALTSDPTDAPLTQLLDDAATLLREPLDFANRNTWADVRNARSKIAEAYKIAMRAAFLSRSETPDKTTSSVSDGSVNADAKRGGVEPSLEAGSPPPSSS